jgi:hypothetical protein
MLVILQMFFFSICREEVRIESLLVSRMNISAYIIFAREDRGFQQACNCPRISSAFTFSV